MTESDYGPRPRYQDLPRSTRRRIRRTFPKELEQIPAIQIAEAADRMEIDRIPNAAWRSQDFMVQAFEEAGGWVRLTVNRVAVTGRQWAEGISWDELQRVKRECGYGDSEAVESYPADRDVVDVAHMRHLWIVPPPSRLGCFWRAAAGRDVE